MQLYSPWVLLALLILPLLAWLMLKRQRSASVKFSSFDLLDGCHISWRVKLRPVLIALRLICITALIIALARPRQGTKISRISTQGIAIELVVDCSGSMAEPMDYFGKQMNRLDVVKKVVSDFLLGDGKTLKGRYGDMVGLITYATYPETVCPLVHSHNILVDFLKEAEPIRVKGLGETAIGDGLALAAARLHKADVDMKNLNGKNKKDTDSYKIKSKVIILLTDGMQNAGQYSPAQAAELAKKWGIKIYAIGVAPERYVQGFFGKQKIPASRQVNESLLNSIAKQTGGFYGRAETAETLQEICKKIDQLEKTEVESIQYMQFAEQFSPLAWTALIILVIEILASCTVFRKIP